MGTDSTPFLGATDRMRPPGARRVWPLVVLAVVVLGALGYVVTRRPAAPAVERASLVIAEVTRGPFVHEIAAAGALVAEQPRLVAAPAAGRVDRIEVEAGDRLTAGAVLLRLSNRETTRQLLEVEQQLAMAEADHADLAATLQARSLESETMLRRTEFEKQDAARQSQAAAELAREGLMPQLEATRRREAAQEVHERVGTEQRRHAALGRSAAAQLDAGRNRVERLRALQRFHRDLVDSLVIRAASETTMREVLVQEGEWVTEGQRLARLVEPGRLKAVLQVPEANAHEVRAGQSVTMSARGTALHGIVHRVATTVEAGAVAVDVRLPGELPSSARPDLSVEGRIEISRSGDALSITRAANAMPNASMPLYRLEGNGRTARKVVVRYGIASVDRIVVVQGATAGEKFIIAGVHGRMEPELTID